MSLTTILTKCILKEVITATKAISKLFVQWQEEFWHVRVKAPSEFNFL